MSSVSKYQPAIALLSPADSDLQHIKEEIDSIRKMLEQEDSIKDETQIISEKDVTLENFATYLGAYHDRIIFLHFSGHADTQTLVFTKEKVRSEGVASFLSHQPNLVFVFLNGCSTLGQVEQLMAAGIPAVIATCSPVEDRMSKDFAIRFYENLITNQLSLEEAFTKAKALIEAQRDQSIEIIEVRSIGFTDESRFSEEQWGLYINEENPWIHNWALKDAYHNPFIGMPRISDSIGYPTGNKPFRGLHWYRKEDSRIFFGRSKEIIDLYKDLSDPNRPQLHLIHGQSGVGKSSLLFAGLLPRMIDEWDVYYFRKDYIEQAKSVHIGKEKTLFIFDQLEEVILKGRAHTLQFLTEVKSLFIEEGVTFRPKLMFSFRKEYFADFNDALNKAEIEFLSDFIHPITEEGVVSIIKTLTLYNRTREKYRLKVKEKEDPKDVEEEELSAYIAKLVTFDRQASVAPTLQLLLTSMWDKAIMDETGWRTFDKKLLEKVKSDGIYLDEYLDHLFDQWYKSINEHQRQFSKSGLYLDVLYELVSPHTTAREQNWDYLKRIYIEEEGGLQTEQLQLVLDELNGCYLIFKSKRKEEEVFTYRLAHDTLAPIVLNRFNTSEDIGQKARRILEYKVKYYTGNTPGLLSKSDLEWIEQGRLGMRKWKEDEVTLIKQSKAELKRQNRGKRIIRMALGGLGLALLLVGGAFVWSAYQNQLEATAQSLENQGDANVNNPITQLNFYYQSLLKTPENRERKAKLYATYRDNIFSKIIHQNDAIVNAAIAPNGAYFATLERKSGENFEGIVYQLQGTEIQEVARFEDIPSAEMNTFFFTADGQRIIGGGNDHKIHSWTLDGKRLKVNLGKLNIEHLAATQHGKYVVASFINEDFLIKVNMEDEVPIDTLYPHGKVTALGFLPDDKTIVFGKDEDGLFGFLEGSRINRYAWTNSDYSKIHTIQPNYEDQTLFIGDSEGLVILGLFEDEAYEVVKEEDYASAIFSFQFSSDKSLLFTKEEGKTTLTNWRDSMFIRDLPTNTAPFTKGSFSKDKKYLYTLNESNHLEVVPLYILDNQQELKKERQLSSITALATGSAIDAYEVTAGTYFGNAARWSMPELSTLTDLQSAMAGERITALDAGKNITVMGDDRGGLMIANTVTGELINVQDKLHAETIHQVLVSPDEKSIITLSADKNIGIWDEKGNLLDTLKNNQRIEAAAFSEDSKKFLTINESGEIKERKMGQGYEVLNTFSLRNTTEKSPFFVAYVADGQEVIAMDGGGRLQKNQVNGELIGDENFSPLRAVALNSVKAGQAPYFAFMTLSDELFFGDEKGNVYHKISLPNAWRSTTLVLHGNTVFIGTDRGKVYQFEVDRPLPEVFIEEFYSEW